MIRPMTGPEIVIALRRSAAACMEQDRSDWWSNEICVSDSTYDAARHFDDESCLALDDEHAATFLLLVAEATNA